ncbi:LOW QUALITY PROTEIN: SCO-spondin-like [Pangshura tecta]
MLGAARGRGLCAPAGELMGTLLWLWLWVPAVLAEGRWCERTEQVTEEQVVSPRREQAVPCADVPHHHLAGWRIDQHRMHQAYGGDQPIGHLYAQAGSTGSLCYIYKPPDTRPVVWNRTVRACCQGWSGPHCTQGEGFLGLCFSTWQCQAGLGTWNLSLLSMAECCGRPWGRSWKNTSSELCLSCSALPLPGDLPAPSLLRPLPPTALLGLPRPRHRLFATCVTWAGFHYRSFDGKYFHFHGDCTYSLAAASDGTWAVDISGSRTCTPPHCHRALRMLFGLDLVVAQGRNVSVNGAAVLEGEPLLQDGISVRWLGDFVFVESGLGVRVKSDGRETVYVTVSGELRGATRGLCGLYDDDPADDFLRVGGDVATLAASFGNSWRVPDASPELPCQDAAETGHSCDIAEAGALRQEAEAVCQKLLASPFSQCHSEVDPGGFYDACMYAFCQQGGTGAGRQEAVCATFASYARDCAQQHVYVDWRRPGFCEKQCGQGKQYSDCVSSCPASCAAVGTGEEGHCRDECVSGCECPPGLYLEGGACVPESDCPCYHRRQKYSPGQSIQQRCNQCTCQGGRWRCSQDKCSAECALIGDPHYVTFDQKRYSFHGVCEYILVQDFVDWKLLITAEKVACGSKGAMSCLRALTVTAHRTSARLHTTGDVAVNGQEVALPFASADLSIRRASSSFLLLQAFGAHVLWGLELPAAYITLQPGFAGKVRGLCGTYNWNQQDEFTTPAGDVESSIAAFANKFQVSSECPALGSFAFDPCGTYAQRREFAEAACAVLHGSAFQPCHGLVEREPYYQLCLYDVCGCSAGGDCLCSALAAYARQCAQEGVPVPWRNQTFCAVPCSGGQVYQECSAPCRKSCADLRLGEASSCQALAVCVAGCNCPEGLVLDDSGQCVPPGTCPCEHGGETYPPGSKIHRSCNGCICVDGLWNCTDDSCPEAAFCPGELVYAHGSCLRTCATAEGNLSCPGLSDGCVCPPGTVFLNEHCVSPDECPCHHNGRLYQPNDTIAKDCNTCVCRSRRWQCSSHHCAGNCVATGDPHYITFDGRAFSFLGDCEYVLARESSGLFTVTSENVPCGTSGVTCTKSVVVVIGNTVVHLLRGKDVTVNGVSVRPPKTYSGNGLTLERAGVFLILISQLGLSVLWDGGTRVYVKLDPRYQGRVEGLCGNFDGDTENDFTSRQGIVEPTSDLFGNSWRVSLLCPEVNNEDFEHPCIANAHRGTWARKRCSIIMQHLFAPCHEEVPCQQFYDWCVFDACGCDSGGDCECLCTAIAAYAEECNQRGVYVRWRSQELCPMQCDNGLEYEACGPACPQTCKSFGLEPSEHCDAISCVEGCFCPDGRVLRDGSCIDPAECPCFWEGISFPAGAVVKQECKNCTCEAGLWQCDAPAEPCLAPPRCPEAEFACRTGGRCVPSAWVCDNEDDCGDGSDEFCVPSCAPQQYQCASGQCVAWGYRCDGTADCLDHSDERDCLAPGCAQQEFRCANGRCIPQAHVCDGELDCGFADESDEAGCGPPCGAGEFSCAAGRCVPYLHRCDGHDDCGDFSDERECVCPPGDFQCPDALCLPPALVCDGKRHCPTGTDEAFCPGRVTCAPGQLLCPDGSCVSRTRVCDGAWDCGDGSDESPARCPTARPSALPTALPATRLPLANRTAAPPCGRYEFHCGSGECRPRGWVCDDEADCLDGSDELVCNRTCGLDQHTCAVTAECIPYGQLCDGIPQCRDQSDESTDNCGSTEIPPCPGLFVCNNRMCVNVSRVCDGSHDCPQGEDELACGEEQNVPGGERNQTVGPCAEYSCAEGKCIPFKQVCNGLADCADGSEASGWLPSDEQDCGLWSPWAPWSTCSRSCGTGLQIRRRVCTRRANDVLRHCHGEETQAQQCFTLACPVDGAWSEWATWANCTQDCRGVVVRRRECILPRNGGRHCSELPGASPSTLEIMDCILSPWSGWSECSRSCGLGVTFRRRDLLRNALPGGQCERNEFDSRSCFLRACPVNGAWAPWGEWSDCDAECRGGVRSRTRSCADPPPKNGGQPCPGDAVQTEPCNLQPCGDARDCGPEMVHVQAGDCERGLVAPCPQSCRELNAERSCQSRCVEGCRCPPGLYLQEGGCVNISQCHCDFSQEQRRPGEMFLHDNCSQCVCLDGVVTCDDLACPVHCGWSAWSPWTPCDRSCGVGMRERFRSPTNPAPANGGTPCEGDAQQVRECHTACVSEPAGPWSDWTPFPCSKTCFYDVDRVGVRKRFRHCNDTGEGAGRCQGAPAEEEQCDTPPCPVEGVWTPWTAWSRCSAACDSGVQTRSRTCSNPAYGGPECTGPLLQTRDCNSQPCRARCPAPMIYQTAEECRRGGGACPRLCLDQGAGVECATRCYPGCYCPDGLFLQDDSCVPQTQCRCYHQGVLYQPGDTAPRDACSNCTCVAGEMVCGTEPCPVHCGWSGWTEWSSCSRSCNVGTRRRYRSGSDPPAAFGGRDCQGPGVEVEFCSLQPCRGSGAEWGPWSRCSVPCGGGYQNRTRGSAARHRIEFTTCNLQPCSGEVPGVCPEGKLWQECADAPASCAELGTDPPADRPCQAGCYCPPSTVLLNNLCVAAAECPCAEGGELYAPGDVVPKGCESCSCEAGRISNCSRVACGDVSGGWSDWTPWSECSASCGFGLQNRYRFCTAPPPSGTGLPCLGPEREEQPCQVQPCSRSGGWSAWSPWTECTKSCGEGLRSRARACDSPTPLGHGDYCEGPPAQVETCHLGQCPALDCAAVQGSIYSRCGPSCPRSCDDISHCRWSCEPGCYCTGGRVLNANGSACVETQGCSCLDLLAQERYLPGETVAHQDGCNNCTCTGGLLLCTSLPCPVAGAWCDWSPWTPCSRTCGSEVVTRYRACACPTPQHGGPECAGAQERHGDTGTQLQHKECPSAAFCPVDGGWSSWGPWSACAACAGESTRSRECSSPPARFGGVPCPGEARQSRACHDGDTVCEGCGGGQVAFACGKPCPRSCEDLQTDTVCLDSPQCQRSCGCPAGRLLQDGACVSLARCRCKHPNGSLEAPEQQPLSAWAGPVPWEYVQPGQTVYGPCQNCTCEDGHLQCRADPACRLDGGWGAWGPWSPCPQGCQEGTQFRFRECANPAPQHGGRGCLGDSQQQRACLQGEPPCQEEAPWSDWSPWAPCSVSCGGGEQIRTRQCRQPACQGLAVQSKTCHTQVCLEVGCPAGRLYRECLQEEGCPYSCAHLTRQMDCFSDGCEEGCHCPAGTYQHHGACVQECPCLVTAETLQELQNHSANASALPAVLTAQGRWVSLGQEVQPRDTVRSACSTCTCHNGQLNCSFTRCPLDGGFAPWSLWTPCSVSCGGLGHMTRARGCTSPAPANGGKDCVGPRTDIKYCQAPDCPVTPGPTKEPVPSVPGSAEGFSLWSPWSPCSRTCTDPEFPATKTRTRLCAGGANCTGESFQERACNLPQCTDAPPCVGEECAGRNCTWTPWAPWSECSRSCGVGQQRRLRTYHPPGERGLWCHGILTANTERRFCNLQACKVPGAWSKWSPWSWCDRTCGGGRSVRARTCTSPPPKNGGARCPGEKYQGRVCNPRPCEEGCPPAMAMVDCANRCPRHCWDLQEGITCQDGETCEPGCRCPDGTLEQDGACVSPQHCECTDAQGHSWVPGSLRHDGCNNCTCSEGRLLCTRRTCPPSQCDWSHWSRWSPCSVTCGDGLQTRFRTATSGSWARECLKEQLQTRPCPQGPCPPLCLHQGWERRLGDTWLLGECQQCICTPEGIYCQDIACAVPGSWTPWSPWSDCPVTCGNSTHVRTRACINPPPRNNGSHCAGPEAEAQGCAARPCPAAEQCDWSAWSPCSRSCGTGLATRTGTCACPSPEGPSTPCNDSARQEVEPCYLRPCQGDCSWSPWTPWTQCSCSFLVQQRYRNQLGPGPQGALCVGLDGEFRTCDASQCSEASCEPPFEFQECGVPCASLCSTLQRQELCTATPSCLPGCYCPQGLVAQRGACVPPAQCGCLHLPPGEGPVHLAAGDTVLVGCKECVCQEGALQCSSESCQGLLPLSEWSAWTPCSSCLPLSALSPGTLSVLLAQRGGWQASGPPQPDVAPLASVQHRYRLCLDPQTGLPWAGEAALCSAELQQEQLCPDPHLCEDLCLWSEWSPWGPCREPCSGGFRLRRRHVQHPADSRRCWGARVQSESCNTAACPGEECEDRGKEHAPACANRCPRTCADLWEHVECLQRECKPGCRCPEGQLLQDGVCVPVLACRCGLPTANGTRELWPGQAAELDCHNCTCGNGTFACPDPECPFYGPWSEWSPCSATCGGGSTLRHRPCQESPTGAPCTADAMEEMAECNLQPCPAGCQLSPWSAWSPCSASCGGGVSERSRSLLSPGEGRGEHCPAPLLLHRACHTHNCTPECPGPQVHSDCANACPRACADLRPGTACLREECQPGCACPPAQVLQDGACVPPDECRCSLLPAPAVPWASNLSQEERAREYPAGSTIHHQCNSCVCRRGTFSCSQRDCDVDCLWSVWSAWSACSVTCGPGVRISQRHQLQQRLYAGAECLGPPTRRTPCSLPDCACPTGERWLGPGPTAPCERTCQQIYEEPRPSCSVGAAPGCVCEAGRYRNSSGDCVTAAHCECEHGGQLRPPGAEWQEACESCRCLNGRAVCTAGCPPLFCLEGEVKVQEPGSCCPVCRRESGRCAARDAILRGDIVALTLTLILQAPGAIPLALASGPSRPPRPLRTVLELLPRAACCAGLLVSCRGPPQRRLHAGAGRDPLAWEGSQDGGWCDSPHSFAEEPSAACQRYTEVRNITKGRCALPGVEVSYCSGRCASRTNVISEEPYLQTLCDCCSYHLDPLSPVRILSLPCEDGEVEPVVLPVIHSCDCSPCQGEWSRRTQAPLKTCCSGGPCLARLGMGPSLLSAALALGRGLEWALEHAGGAPKAQMEAWGLFRALMARGPGGTGSVPAAEVWRRQTAACVPAAAPPSNQRPLELPLRSRERPPAPPHMVPESQQLLPAGKPCEPRAPTGRLRLGERQRGKSCSLNTRESARACPERRGRVTQKGVSSSPPAAA